MAHQCTSTEPTHLIAEAAHTNIVNALSTPSLAAVHDRVPAPVSVVISNPEVWARKRAALLAAGPSRLQVIADFDRTLSAFRTRTGALCASSHELLENCVGLDRDTFLPQMDAINTKYFALEVSPNLTAEQRAEYMLEWWHQAHALLLAQGIRRQDISNAVERARTLGMLQLREGAPEFLQLLLKADIPCLVFSAGLKETIQETLKQEQLLLPNLHLIGNEMEFHAESGKLMAFGQDTITSSNKNYSHVHLMEPDFHARSLSRRNVILLGDNIGDAGMATGLDDAECIVRIGLLHDHAEERLGQFKEAFDVVLLNDVGMEFAHKLVEDVINGRAQEGQAVAAPAAAAATAPAAAPVAANEPAQPAASA